MRYVLIFITVLTALFLLSCGESLPSPGECLAYQVYPLALTAEYDLGDSTASIEVNASAAGEATVTFLAPSSLAGIVFDVSAEGVRVVSGEITTPALSLPSSQPAIITALFSLDESRIKAITADDGALTYTAVFASDIGDVSVVFDSRSGAPLTLSAGDFTLRITEIKTQNGQSIIG